VLADVRPRTVYRSTQNVPSVFACAKRISRVTKSGTHVAFRLTLGGAPQDESRRTMVGALSRTTAYEKRRRDGHAVPSAELLSAITSEIIPRLVSAHPSSPPPIEARVASHAAPVAPSPLQVALLAQVAMTEGLPGACALLATMCPREMSPAAILLQLVAPAARLLGEQWERDERSFTEVSFGLGTLEQLVTILGTGAVPGHGLVVLAAAPGETHTLGLRVVCEVVRLAGWNVHIAESEPELLALVATEWVELVGITVTIPHLIGPLLKLLRAVRKTKRNPDMGVMLGGAPGLADFVARNEGTLYADEPRDAVRWLEAHAANRTL
jgi:MerR family transcriptional regulator, light-induced transcriptional regulator